MQKNPEMSEQKPSPVLEWFLGYSAKLDDLTEEMIQAPVPDKVYVSGLSVRLTCRWPKLHLCTQVHRGRAIVIGKIVAVSPEKTAVKVLQEPESLDQDSYIWYRLEVDIGTN